jgi:outer membrane protein OmpA-like peptidoglycan-associated protein
MFRYAVALLAVLASPLAVAGPDSRGDALMQLARAHLADSDKEGALHSLEQAIDVCPSYEAYEAYAEAASGSLSRPVREKAAAAFVEAEYAAPSDTARAHALYRYARLLDQEHEPQQAFPLLNQARALTPHDPDIETLAARVDQEIQHPSQDDIVRELSFPLARPLRAHTGALIQASGGGAPEKPATNVSTDPPAPAPVYQRTVPAIPTHFLTGSVQVEASSSANIRTLATALGSSALKDMRFKLIGHAHSHGNAASNQHLSKERARAVAQMLMFVQPTLGGRLTADGHGSPEPIDPGHDERAYWANRRLQVVLIE